MCLLGLRPSMSNAPLTYVCGPGRVTRPWRYDYVVHCAIFYESLYLVQRCPVVRTNNWINCEGGIQESCEHDCAIETIAPLN